jgi:HEPN domain-containing protein
MLPDDARLQDARAWLVKAELDLKAAHEIAAPSEGLWGDVMFHAQQAAEKSMKAFLAWHDVPFRKTHNLDELGQQCAALDATLAAVAHEAAPLTEYAWKFRYPGETGEPDRVEAELALVSARRVYERHRTVGAWNRPMRRAQIPFPPCFSARTSPAHNMAGEILGIQPAVQGAAARKQRSA